MASLPQVVWVAQWYPHEGEPYAGDFIQRHAKAVALYMPVHVFACFPDTRNCVDVQANGNLTETIIYFKPTHTGNRFLNKVLLWKRWKQLLQNAIQQHIASHGVPDLLHCHITLNAGWLGLWAKKKLDIPYLITEHWSGYMPGASNSFNKYNRWSKRLFRKIIQESAFVVTVSEALTNAMQSIDSDANYIRIPNVVDEAIFHLPVDAFKKENFRLLHISTFNFQKNMPAMLAAFDKVAVAFPKIEFHIVGPKAKFQKLFPIQSADTHYVLHGEIPQEQIALLMHQSDACVLYSHYETFGCVIIEANAAGLPVIVSDIPVLQEIVQAGQNGVLVTSDDSNVLAQDIISFLNNQDKFRPKQIAAEARAKYSFSVVGKQFVELYQSLVSKANIDS